MRAFTFLFILLSNSILQAQCLRELNAAVHIIPNFYEIGSGFIFNKTGDSANVVTAKHVIEFAEKRGRYLPEIRTVFITNDTIFGGRIMYEDDSLDLVLIRIGVPLNFQLQEIALDTGLDIFKKLNVASAREGWVCIPADGSASYVYSCCNERGEAEMAMNGIYPGNSGSMVFSEQGIAGMVVRNSENLVYMIPVYLFEDKLQLFE